MKEIIAKIGRQNHQNHIIGVMPLITIVFGIQCYLIYHFAEGVQVGDYALLLGASLATFVSWLMYYDNYHHVFICKDHLHIYFPLFGTNYEIEYQDIESIVTPEEECNFSSIIVKTKEGRNHVFHFVDFPVATKTLIEEQMKKTNVEPAVYEEDFDQAA